MLTPEPDGDDPRLGDSQRGKPRESAAGGKPREGTADGRSTVIFVTSPRARVGKTLAARLVIDFFRGNGRHVNAFDANPADPTLSRYVSAEPANLSQTRGQVLLFDRLIIPDRRVKVIDLAADQFETMQTILRETRFAEEAKAAGIDTVIAYVAENHPRSAEGYKRLAANFPELTLLPVHNQPVAGNPGEPLPHPARGSMPLRLAHLPPALVEAINRPGFTFAEGNAAAPAPAAPRFSPYAKGANPYAPPPAQQGLDAWVAEAFLALRDLELRLSMESFASLFRYGAWAI